VLLARAKDPNFTPEPDRSVPPITNTDPGLLFGEARTKRAEGERVLISFEE